MKRHISIILLALFSLIGSVSAQEIEKYSEPVFEAGEKATYNLYFNWGFVWIHAGDCSFKVQNKKYNGKTALSLQVAGVTTPTFDKMYTIRDSFESYTTPSITPIYYYEAKNENSYHSKLTYHYRYAPTKTYVDMHRTKRGQTKDKTLTLDTETHDLISSCYNFRNVNTDKLKTNQTIPFKMVFDDDIYSLGLCYKGKTTVTLKNGQTYRALKFVPKLITGDLFKNEDDMIIYVTDDQNHIPLLIEAKIKVGSVKAMLSSISHHKYPLTSLVSKKKKK